MATKRCFHCGENVEIGAPHDCWTTTPEALTRGLSEELVDAWERLRETAEEFGEQRVYASHKSIMFARKVCYFFVRPRTKDLEVVFFLGREVRDPLVRKSGRASRAKVWHMARVTHRDQVEAPLTDWLREAYEVSEQLSRKTAPPAGPVAVPMGRGVRKKVRGVKARAVGKRARSAGGAKPPRKTARPARKARRQKKR